MQCLRQRGGGCPSLSEVCPSLSLSHKTVLVGAAALPLLNPWVDKALPYALCQSRTSQEHPASFHHSPLPQRIPPAHLHCLGFCLSVFCWEQMNRKQHGGAAHFQCPSPAGAAPAHGELQYWQKQQRELLPVAGLQQSTIRLDLPNPWQRSPPQLHHLGFLEMD